MRYVLIFCLACLCLIQSAHAGQTYERVMDSRKLRCAYVTYPPVILKDPNTGELSGLMVDVMTEIGRLLDLEIVWAEEIGFADSVAGLNAGRYDAVCIGFWRSTNEGRFVGYTMPLYYSQVGVYVRQDDDRFDKSLEAINDPNVKIVSIDGELNSLIARRDFPNAQLYELPNLSDRSLVFQDLVTGKADIVFREGYTARQYMEANPGTVKQIHKDKPLRVFQNTIGIPMGDVAFKSMLDSAVIELHDHGTLTRLLNRYDPNGEALLRVAPGYLTP